MQGELFDSGRAWLVTHRADQRIAALADRHYSRQTVGSEKFAPPGEGIFLVARDGGAAWVAVRNRFAGVTRFRNTLFRNEGAGLSSALLVEAVDILRVWWPAHYGYAPGEPLQTEVDPAKTRRKRDPGRCYRRAGWHHTDTDRDGRLVFEVWPWGRLESTAPGQTVGAQALSDSGGAIPREGSPGAVT